MNTRHQAVIQIISAVFKRRSRSGDYVGNHKFILTLDNGTSIKIRFGPDAWEGQFTAFGFDERYAPLTYTEADIVGWASLAYERTCCADQVIGFGPVQRGYSMGMKARE